MTNSNSPSDHSFQFKKPELLVEQLEERVLFDAVPVPAEPIEIEASLETQMEAISGAVSSDRAEEQSQQAQANEVVFVDKSVEGLDEIVANFVQERNVEVFFINGKSSGLEQIANHLEGRSDISALHIISHGQDAQLQLGNSTVTSESLRGEFAVELARIGQSLSADGDILIYGCNLGATSQGQDFVNQFAELTDADVAASDDLTGHASLGGDWHLEFTNGKVESRIIVSEEIQKKWIDTLQTFGELVGVDISAATDGNQPANWSHLTGAGTVNNLIDETGANTGISLTMSTTGTLTGYNSNPPAGAVPDHPNDLSGIGGSFYDNSGGVEQIDLTWSGLNAGQEYALYTFATAAFNSLQSVEYTGGNGTVSHDDVFFGANTILINGSLGSSANELTSYATIMTADASGEISVRLTSNYWALISGAAIQAVADVPADLTADVDLVIEDTSPNPVSGNVLDNDSSNSAMTITEVNGNAANVGNVINGAYGDLVLNADGTYTYTLDDTAPEVQSLNAQDNIVYLGSHDGSGPNASSEGQIEAVNLTTGASTVVTSTNQVAYINGLAANADNNLAYYGDDDNIYFWDPTTDTHGTLADLASLGLPANEGLLSGGATYYDGALYIGLEPDGAGPMTDIYRLDLASDGLSVTSATNLNVSAAAAAAGFPSVGGFGDLIVSDNTLYGSTTVAGFWSFDLVTEEFRSITDQYRGQLAATEDGRVFSFTGTTGQQIDLGTGDLTGDIFNTILEATDASSAISAPLNPNSVLTETFTYTVEDAEGDVSSTTLTITIGGSNDPPEASDHSIAVLQDSTNHVVNAPNPTDVDNTLDELTFTIDSVPAAGQGTFSIGAGGAAVTAGSTLNAAEFAQLVFTPAPGYGSTVDPLEYTVSDPRGLTDSAVINVTINAAPTATDNTGSVTEDTQLSDSGNVITDDDGSGTDSDPEGETLTVSAVNSSATNVGASVSGTYGTVTIDSTGNYTYLLDNNNPGVSALDNGETLSDSFTYTIDDGNGLTSTATLTITINGTNDDPIVGGTLPDQAHEDAETIPTIDVTSAFSDPDGDSLTYSATGLPSGLSISSAGLITGTLASDASQGGTSGVYTITVTATDDDGADVSTTFTWTVTNPGPDAVDDADATDQNTNATGNVITSNDSDPDGDTITVLQVDGSSGNVNSAVAGSDGGLFTIQADGSYSFDPDGDFDSLAAGDTATTSITYTITDAQGGTDTATLEITITGTNDDPTTVGTIPNQSDVDNQIISGLDVSSFFDDVDDGASLTFIASGLPSGLSIDASGNITGTPTSSASQGGPNSDGIYQITVTASDGQGGFVDQTFTWTITNTTPQTNDDNGFTDQSNSISGNVLTNDSDDDGDSFVVSAVGGSSGQSAAAVGVVTSGEGGGEFVINADGSYTFDPNGDFDHLGLGETADTFINYLVTDVDGATSSVTRLTVQVTGTNDTPTIASGIPDQNHVDGQTIPSIDISSHFADVDNNADLDFTVSGLPAGLSMSLDGLITGTIDNSASQSGPYTVTVTATDEHGADVQQSFTWAVTNPGPTAVDDTNTTDQDSNATGNVLGNDSDPDNDTIEVVAYENSGGSHLPGTTNTGTGGGLFTLNANGSYNFDPNDDFDNLAEGETATTSIQYDISDGEGGTSRATLTITVTGTNDDPQVTGTIPDQTGLDGDTISTIDVSPFFDDIDNGSSLTFSAVGLPDGLSIDSSGNITGTIDNSASQNGPFTVTVTATDEHGATISQSFQWNVNNPGPTATDNSGSVTEDIQVVDSGNLITEDDGDGVDSDPDNDTLFVSAVEGSSANVDSSFTTTYGDLIINADGSYTYTLDNNNAAVNALQASDTLSETFDYTVSDGEGGTSTASLTITINGQNDQPVIGGTIPPQANVDDETISAVDISGLFSDPEGDALTFSAANLPSGLTMNSAGVITGTLDADASQQAPGGVFTVTITATDTSGETVSQDFEWTISNPGPTAVDDDRNTFERQTVSGDVMANDSDVDGDTISVNEVDGSGANVGNVVTGSNGGQFTINADGSFDFDAGNDFDYLRAGEVDTTSVTYQITDGEGGTDTATLTVTVTGNDTDNDGVIDEHDVDDDNDGILDVDECAALAHDSGFDGAITNLSFDITSDNPTDASGNHILNSIIVNGTTYSDFIVPSGFQSNYTNPNAAGIAMVENTNASVFNYSNPNYDDDVLAAFQSNKINLYQRLDPSGGNQWGDGDHFLLDYNVEILSTNRMFVAITERGGNNTVIVEALDQSGNVLGSVTANANSSDYVDMGVEVHPGSFSQNAFASVFALDDIAPVGSFVSQLRVSFAAGSDAGDGKIFIFGDDTTQECPDSDGDGYADHLDIDKDNDGITDNVEAQTTAGYVAPSGIDANNDGLDDIYDAGPLGEAGGWGIQSVDTDNDGVIDALDDDSDDDGFTDQEESGMAAATTTLDSDRDGLFDDYEGSDINDFFDINDENIFGDDGGLDGDYSHFNLAESQGDTNAADPTPNRTSNNAVALIHDLDFRDATPNLAPDAVDDSDSTDQDSSVSGNALDNDSDDDGNPISVSAVNGSAVNVGVAIAGSAGGEFTVNSDGSFSFDPNGEFDYLADGETTTSSITYTISDPFGATDTATIAILITGTNDTPLVTTAIPDQTSEDDEAITPLDISGHFSDADTTDSLTFSASGLPSGLSINAAGVISGTIDNSASQLGGGVYTITVTAEDSEGATVEQTFTWTVTNPGPVASDDFNTTDQATNASGNVMSNDSDPDGDTITVISVGLSAGGVGSPLTGSSGGLFTINANGSYSFDPNGEFDYLDDGESATTQIAYEISDGEGGTETAILEITINGTNDDPTVVSSIPDQANLDGDTVTSLDFSSHFDDVDDTDILIFTAIGLPGGLTIDSAGVISGTIDNSASLSGPFTVTVTATDDNGQTISQSFEWAVSNPGPIATDNAGSVTEDTNLSDSGNVLTDDDGNGTDSDPDNDDLSVSAVDGSNSNVGISRNGAFGSIVINSDGTYTYTLDNNNATVNALDNGETLTETFSYTVSDGEGGTDTAQVTITINGTNDDPVVNSSISDQADFDGDEIDFDISSHFDDPDGDTLTFSATGLPPGLSINPAGEITGTLDADASQGTPGGQYTVTITATDDNGETVSQSFTWTITNPAPTARDNSGNVTEDTDLTDSGNVITDNDGSGLDNDPDGDSLSVSQVDGSGTSVGVTVSGDYGSIVINSDGTYTYTLDNNNSDVDSLDNGDTLTDVFDYTVSDGEGGTSTATLTITINGTNDAPVVGGTIPDQADVDSQTISNVDITPFFSDVDDSLTFSSSGLPDGLTMSAAGVISGTPTSSASQGGTNGVYTVTITATDDNGESVSTTFDWTITNPGPDAQDDSFNTDEDTPFTITVATNDSDPDGDSVAYNQLTNPTNGSVVFHADGTFTYTPNSDFHGTDSFDYEIVDADGATDTATVTITVNPVNDAPNVDSSIPDQSDFDADNIALNISSHFDDIDGDGLTFTATGLPTGLSIDSSGNITGTIDNSASVTGTFTVEVTATDPSGETVTSSFTWTVSNPGPTATDNTTSVTEDIQLLGTGNVITEDSGNGIDSDPDGDDLEVSAVDGASADVGVTVNGTYGTIQINADGSYEYNLNNSHPDVEALDNGESLNETFDYTISDGEGGTSTATLTININGRNDAPVVGSTIPDQADADSETISTFDISSHFDDPDGDTLTFSATGLPPGLSIDSAGEITGTLDADASQGTPGGQYTVTITATDDNGETVSQSFTWTITNPTPTARDNSGNVTEDTDLTDSGNVITDNDGSGLDNDPDGDSLSVSQVDGSGTSVGVTVSGDYGSIVINSDGTYTYTLDNNNSDVDSLDNGDTLTDVFDYTVSDGEGGTSTATLTITINGTNDAPVVGGTIPDQADLDSQTISNVDITPFFSDVDDSLTFSSSGLPDGLTMSAAGVISGTPTSSASQGGTNGVYTVTITATDDNGESVSTTFDWTITNPGPDAQDDSFNTDEDTPFTSTVATNDSDPDGDSVTYNQLTNPTNGSVVFHSDGTFTYTPNSDFHGTDSFDYEIVDADGATDTATVTITVNPVNDAPNVDSSIPDQSDFDADNIALNISSHFDDIDGDGLTFTATGLPTGLSIDSSGNITGTIDNSASVTGTFTVEVTATDPSGETVTSSFTWTVTNPGPTATDNTTSVTEDIQLLGTGNVITEDSGNGVDSDPDGDDLEVSAVDGASADVGVTVNGTYGTIQINADGSYEYNLNNSHPDVEALDNGESLSETFDYTISDGEGGTSTATLTININGRNDAPVVGSTIPDQSNLDIDNIAGLDISGAFTDVDDSDLTFSISGLPAGLTMDPSTGVISGTIDNNASTGSPLGDGSYEVTVTATDDNGQSVATSFTWTIANHTPDANDDSFVTNEDVGFIDTVTGNDSDFDADIVSYSLVNGPGNGNLTFNPDGSFTYTPEADFHGTDTFDYELCDEDGDCSQATVTITVNPVNDAPVVESAIPDQADTDGESISLDISSHFSDIEGGLTFAATGLPGGLTIDSSGLISGTIDSSASAGGPYTVVVTAEDPEGATITDTFTWSVSNPAPDATNDSFSTDEDVPFSGDVSLNDSDPDNDNLTYEKTSDPSNGTVVFNSDGTFTYTPAPGFSGHDSFEYKVIDADGAETAATVFISIGPVNDLPVIDSPIPDQTNLDSETISLDISTSFSDPENDTLTFSATGLPPGLSISNEGLISGTIDSSASQGGPYTVVITADDGNGGSITDTFSWNVDNPAPVANDDSLTTNEDTPVSASVISNDSDPDGDNLSYNLTNGPSNGSLTLNPDGSFTYTPDANFHGVDSFDYEACDADGACTTATVTITINPINDAPTVATIPDQANLDSEVVSIDVSTFFDDVDGDALTFSANNLPPSLSIDPGTGVISGVLDSSASQGGPYTVEVVVNDANGGAVGQFFEWTVDNPGPNAEDDSFTTTEDTSFSASVTFNDSDPDSDATSYNLLSGPFDGNVAFNPDGTFTYTPNTDFHGTDTFDYQIVDADGATDTASVTITVDPVNDAPVVASPIPDQSNFDVDVISLDTSVVFSDVEGDGLTYSATGLPPGLSIDPGTGIISGTLDPDASQGGPYSVTLTVDDGAGGTTSDTFSWNVENPLPTAIDDNFTTNEDVSFLDTVATNDNDPDDGVTFTLLNTPDHGTLIFNSDGSFEYTPDAGYNGFDSFDYEICDTDGDCDIATATIAIGAVNDPPVVVNPLPDQLSFDDETTVISVAEAFNDEDGDTLTYTATGLPPGLVLNPNSGLIVGDLDTSASAGGPYTVVVTADDGNGGTATDTFTWSVFNRSPLATNDSYVTTEDTPVSGTVASNDHDVDRDTLTFTLVSGPSNGSLTINPDGTFNYTPDQDFHGSDSFVYLLTDADGATDTAVATITITPVNDAPVANDDSGITSEDTPVTIAVLDNDSDPDNDPLTVSIVDGPDNGTISLNPDGSIEYLPELNFNGTDTFEYRITDPSGQTTTATVTIDVTPVNDPPVATDDGFTTDEDTTLVGTVAPNDIDPDGDPLIFVLDTPPAEGTLILNPDGTFVYDPPEDFNGQVTFDYSIVDPSGSTDAATATIAVLATQDPPAAKDDSGETSQNASILIQLIENDSDPDNDPLTVVSINGVALAAGESVELPSGAIVTINDNGTVAYNPNGAFDELTLNESALDSFDYTISDGNGGTASATAVVTINGENDPPIAEDDFVKTTTDTAVTVSVLNDDFDPEGEPLSVILLNQPANGTATVNPDGTITYTPDEAYEGTDHIHYLVEDPHGATNEATLTIEVEPEFRFDSFTNFSESNFAHLDRQGVDVQMGGRERVLSQRIFSLAPEPIFSGFARPGTQIVGKIYDSSGAVVGEATATSDPGGNWLMQFQGTRGFEFYRIEFEQVASAGGADIYGYFGLNTSDNSYQAMEALTSYDKPLSVEGAMTTSLDTLEQSQRNNNDPLGFGR